MNLRYCYNCQKLTSFPKPYFFFQRRCAVCNGKGSNSLTLKVPRVRPSIRRSVYLNFWAFILIILGILTAVGAEHYLGGSPSWKHLSELIGHALIVAGIFSFLIEFKDFTNYTSRILREQLLERRYIQTLGPEELQKLKRDVDAEILGATNLVSRNDFYAFVGNYSEKFLKMPYRSQMTDTSTFEIVPKSPEVIRKRTVTRYVFVKGLSSEGEPMMVNWSMEYPKKAMAGSTHAVLAELKLVLFEREHNDWVKKKTFEFTNKSDKKDGEPIKFTLTERTNDGAVNSAQRTRGIEPIEVQSVEVVDEADSTLISMRYSFKYEIPRSRLFQPEEEVMIEITENSLMPSTDHQYFVRLSYPTRNLTVTCHFPDCIKSRAEAFGFTSSSHRMTGGNTAVVVLDDWCVPGHAALVEWDLPSDWNEIVNEEKYSQRELEL